MDIIVKNLFVEAHHSIGLVELYHEALRQVYAIIAAEIPEIHLELALQIVFQAINNSVGLNGFVLTLLEFGVFPRMIKSDVSSPTITERVVTMQKSIDEVKKSIALR